MPEHDLKLICQNIPVNDSGSVSTQANAILKGISGQDVEFDIQTGGSNPTLFPPILATAMNKVNVNINSAANGQFVSVGSIKYFVNGVEVPGTGDEYNVRPQDNGLTLAVHLTASDFNDGIATVTLVYVDPSSQTLSVTVNIPDTVTTDLAFWTEAYSTSSYRYLNNLSAPHQNIIWWLYDYSTTTVYFSNPILSIYAPQSTDSLNIYQLISSYEGLTRGWFYRGYFSRNMDVSTITSAYTAAVNQYTLGYGINIPSTAAGTFPNYSLQIVSSLNAIQNGSTQCTCYSVKNLGLNNNATTNSSSAPFGNSASCSGNLRPSDGNITFGGSISFSVIVN